MGPFIWSKHTWNLYFYYTLSEHTGTSMVPSIFKGYGIRRMLPRVSCLITYSLSCPRPPGKTSTSRQLCWNISCANVAMSSTENISPWFVNPCAWASWNSSSTDRGCDVHDEAILRATKPHLHKNIQIIYWVPAYCIHKKSGTYPLLESLLWSILQNWLNVSIIRYMWRIWCAFILPQSVSGVKELLFRVSPTSTRQNIHHSTVGMQRDKCTRWGKLR